MITRRALRLKTSPATVGPQFGLAFWSQFGKLLAVQCIQNNGRIN